MAFEIIKLTYLLTYLIVSRFVNLCRIYGMNGKPSVVAMVVVVVLVKAVLHEIETSSL